MNQKKLAVFGEGLTEILFAEALICWIGSTHSIAFEVQKWEAKKARVLRPAPTSANTADYFILLMDCTGESAVKSAMNDQLPSLEKSGYGLVLGLQDIFPTPISELPEIEKVLQTGIVKSRVRTRLFLAVAEIEAWFIEEHTHFQKIAPNLTLARIAMELGVDLTMARADSIGHPAKFLHDAYALEKKAYLTGKKRSKVTKRIQRTVSSLDYNHLYTHSAKRLPHLKLFMDELNSFIV